HVKNNSVLHETVILMTFVADRRPRVPLGERHLIEGLGHCIYRIQVRLGFMQPPDIPLTLHNCKMLDFDVDLAQAHYYIAHEVVLRRARNSAMAAVPFAIFASSPTLRAVPPISSRSPMRGYPKSALISKFERQRGRPHSASFDHLVGAGERR